MNTLNGYKYCIGFFFVVVVIYCSYILSNSSQGIALVIDNNNKAVVGGFIVTGLDNEGFPTSNFVLTRYLDNGGLDASFNFNGVVSTYIDNGAALIQDMALDGNDKYIAIGGASYFPRDPQLAALATQFGFNLQDVTFARYNQNGTLDTTFNKTGIYRNPIIPTNQAVANAVGNSLAIDHNDKIVGSGFLTTLSSAGTVAPFFLIRLNEDGTLDTTFNPNGETPGILISQLTSQIGEVGSININAVEIDSMNRIVCTGYFASTIPFLTGIQWITIRVNPDGTFDNTFGNNGVVLTSIQGFDVAASLQIDLDGNIVVAGNASNGYIAVMALAKYDNSGNLIPTFGDNGIVTTNISNNTDRIQYIAIDSSNRIVACGFTSLFIAFRTPLLTPSGDNFTMLRYNSDGTLDQTFGDETTIYLNTFGSLNNPSILETINGAPVPIVPLVSVQTFGIKQVNIQNNFPLDPYTPFVPSIFPASAFSIRLDFNNRIVVSGFSRNATEADFTVLRLNPDGQLDETFDSPFNDQPPFQPGVVITYLSLILGFTNLNNSGYLIPPDYSYLLNNNPKKFRANRQQNIFIAAPQISSNFNNIETNITNPLISGSAAPGTQVILHLNGVPTIKALTDAGGKWSTILPHLKDGKYSLHATATDRVSSISAPSNAMNFTVNTKNKDLKNTSKDIKSDVNNKKTDQAVKPVIDNNYNKGSNIKVVSQQKVITGQANPNQKVKVFVNNVKQDKNSISSDKNGKWSFNVPKQYLNTGQNHKVAVAVDNTIQNFNI